MSEINNFKVFYYGILCDSWYSVYLTLGGWYYSWWCRYLTCQDNDLYWVLEI
jgi:hypothetical protein